MSKNWSGPLRLLCVLVTLSLASLHAQARPGADRDDTLSAFAGYSRVYTDYGVHDNGFVFGADVTRNYRRFSPSLEARYTRSLGSNITENSFTGGFKAAKRLGRFQPYGDVIVGYGIINFKNGPPDYKSDNSILYGAGGGLDYRVTRSISAKVDFQQQYWNLGSTAGKLTPDLVTFGIVYTVPFGFGRGQRFGR
jgi:opacity protein-like surface antigen